jgi:hypothetical protein
MKLLIHLRVMVGAQTCCAQNSGLRDEGAARLRPYEAARTEFAP